MTKAKTIDRLELTRKKFSNTQQETETGSQEQQEQQEEHYGLSTCPNCEQMTLIHDGGCSHCPSCGWSACG